MEEQVKGRLRERQQEKAVCMEERQNERWGYLGSSECSEEDSELTIHELSPQNDLPRSSTVRLM